MLEKAERLTKMAPIETFVRQKINPELLNDLRGVPVTGVLVWERKDDPQTLEETLRSILTRHSQRDSFKSEKAQKQWEKDREKYREKHGDRAIILLFPEKGHREFNVVVSSLSRNRINSVDDLLANPQEAFRARRIDFSGTGGGARREAVQAIIDHFTSVPNQD